MLADLPGLNIYILPELIINNITSFSGSSNSSTSDTLDNEFVKTVAVNLQPAMFVAVVSETKPLPLVDELGHLLLHLFALQLLLQENLETRHRGRPLGVLLVGLRRKTKKKKKMKRTRALLKKQQLTDKQAHVHQHLPVAEGLRG